MNVVSGRRVVHAAAVGSLAAVALLVASVSAGAVPSPGSGIIATVAGTGTSGYSGDGGQATSANLSYPSGVAVDGSGNVYIADRGNHRVRKVTSAGIISTVAGTGTAGYSGDGGLATSAKLNYPTGVAVDSSGTLFIADYYNDRVRKVTPSGSITTVAGTGTHGYSGDDGPATSANLSYPAGVAMDGSGTLFIADMANDRVRKVTSTGTITTVAGTGTGGYSGDDGPATSANLYHPYGLAVDGSGALFIADQGNLRVRKVTSAGTISTVAGNGTGGYFGDNGPATSAGLYFPSAVAVDGSGNLFIGDSGNERVRKVTAAGSISTVAGTGTRGYSGDGGQATSADLADPTGVAVDGSGTLFVADWSNHRVRAVGAVAAVTPPPTQPAVVAQNGAAACSGGKIVLPVTVTNQSSNDLFGPNGTISFVFDDGTAGPYQLTATNYTFYSQNAASTPSSVSFSLRDTTDAAWQTGVGLEHLRVQPVAAHAKRRQPRRLLRQLCPAHPVTAINADPAR